MITPRLTTLKQPLELIASTALDMISNPRQSAGRQSCLSSFSEAKPPKTSAHFAM
jgi:DNA-binding LacI/PurR family transcriptional regulator